MGAGKKKKKKKSLFGIGDNNISKKYVIFVLKELDIQKKS
jgi:hypothetical protein